MYSLVVSVRRKIQWISVEVISGFQKCLKCKEREFKTGMAYIGPKASVAAVSRQYLGEKTHLKRELIYREASEIHGSQIYL